jgi:apolipoprotein N-acyltransferase
VSGRRLRSLAIGIVLASGWRRAMIACAAGVVSVLAMAPFNIWPVLFVTFPVAIWLIDGAGAGRRGIVAAAWTGWWFGFGYFVAGLYWIGYAFLVDAQTFAWLLPLAVAGLPAYLALFTAAGFALARALWTSDGWRILALAFALTVTEYLRGHLLTGFPWNAFGYALSAVPALAQTASLIGLWGLTFITVAVAGSPAVLVDDASLPRRRLWVAPALAVLTLVAMAAFGAARLAAMPTRFVENVRLRIMQPNLPQDQKFNYGAKADVMRKYLTLSDRSTGPATTGVKDATVLIWPEAAFPFFLKNEPDAIAQISELLPQGTVLVTGAVRPPDGTARGQVVTRAYNSIYVIDHDGAELAVYDKLHLVPFGEFLPFQSLLERIGLTQLTKVQGGFIPGSKRNAIAVPRTPRMLPLICYEVIFPGEMTSDIERPGWIVNLTNDGWFGISTGPYQHLQQARLRAVEEGLPVIRAANTGISAIIDSAGRVVTELGLGEEGVLDSGLPVAASATVYARLGNLPIAIVIAMTAIIVLVRRRRVQRR